MDSLVAAIAQHGYTILFTFVFLEVIGLPVLASHAGQFNLHQKYKPGDPYNPRRFVDPQGFHASVERLEKAYLD